MDTFHTLIFETYGQFNIFLKEYVKLNKQIYHDNNDKIDFYEISNLLINNIKSRTTTNTNTISTSTTATTNTNNYDTQLFNLFELSDLNEFLICLLFASGNQELAIRIIKENSAFIGQQFLNGQINHGIPFAIAFSNRVVLDVLSEQCSIPPTTLIDGNRGLIMTASLYGNLSTIEYLIQVLANGGSGNTGGTGTVGCLGYKNTNGDTPLHFAAMNGDTNIIDVLVNKYQEDLLACNNNGFNVLTCSTFHNQYECIQWLCQMIEKKYGKKMKKQILEHKNKDGETCLLIATRLGFDKSVRVLIDHGCEINTLNKKLKSPFDYLKLVLSTTNNNNSNNENNNNNAVLESFSDQQLQVKLNSLKSSTLPQLQYINQQLLLAAFKDQVLFSHPNFKNITRSFKSFKTIEQLFKNEADKKEKEIEKNLKELLSTEKKLNINNNNNVGNKNKQSQKKQQQSPQQRPPQQQKTTTEMINQKSSTGNNNTTSIKNEEKINNNLKDIKNDKETVSTKSTEKVNEKIVVPDETVLKTTTVITTPATPIPSTTVQPTPSQTEQPQLSNSSKHRNSNLQKSYREEYSELANIYLEQSIKYKEMVMRLGEIENYFSKFNESLYSKNKKAEALGLGVAEILGLGLEYLSSSQLNVLEGIHKDAINEIQNFKNIQK